MPSKTAKKKTAKKTTKKVAKKKAVKSKKPEAPKEKINAVWNKKLIANEKANKKQKKTDEQLKAEMLEQFPDKKGKMSIENVPAVRANYNGGAGMFLAYGKPDGVSRPISFKYDSDGDKIRYGKKIKDINEKTSKKVTKAKKTVKKELAKKASKKVAKKSSKKVSKKVAKK